jgi:hypothetical protein
VSETDRDSVLDLCEACHDYPCSCDLDDLDLPEEGPECCEYCGKPFEDFSDLGCGYCDLRSPEWGLLP